ncbi:MULTISPECIES: alpha/beta hydrolase family protein [Streptomyces]|uniref:alpha/beta hydrolase family protein n=1 Tax=Streptomyces TaxID=1883 RepID=UPI000B1A9B6D|nr:alpha/beta fold hydrolase [Streptomyces sp. XY413]
MKPLLFPNNVQFWYETLRSMSHIAYGGADFGEVVSTGKRITDRSVACFRAAAALFTPVIEPVEIPYEDTTLPGYFYRVDDSGTPRPTLIMHNGFDGTAEELHFFGAMAAVERGDNVLAFDGPGMPGPRHHQGPVFRPDWESVITPVVDFAETLPEVDDSRIALVGLSMGGLLAPPGPPRSSTVWPR